MSHTEARSQFEKCRPVIDLLDGRKHSCEETTVTTRMKSLGDDIWDTTLVYTRRSQRVGKFKGWEHAIQAATKKAIEIADAPPSAGPVVCVGDDSECKSSKPQA
jgi:hypothetical protein